MRLACLMGLLFFGSTVACGSGPAPLTPDTSDPSWQPPGQGDLSIGADPEPKQAAPRPKKARHLQQPNHREMPTKPLHAGNP
jgi:hypothetical protein